MFTKITAIAKAENCTVIDSECSPLSVFFSLVNGQSQFPDLLQLDRVV